MEPSADYSRNANESLLLSATIMIDGVQNMRWVLFQRWNPSGISLEKCIAYANMCDLVTRNQPWPPSTVRQARLFLKTIPSRHRASFQHDNLSSVSPDNGKRTWDEITLPRPTQ